MAQVSTGIQAESSQNHRAGDSGLINIDDWLKAEDEAEAKAEAARLTDEPTRKRAKIGSGRLEVTTIVTGRPTTNHFINTIDSLYRAEPVTPTKIDLCGKNWVGQLFEFRQAHPSRSGPVYTESSPALNLFTCAVTIGEHTEPFGDSTAIFGRKKDAKQYAAKVAVEWLIAHKYMPADGSVTFPKPRPAQQQQQQQQQRATAQPSSSSPPAAATSSTSNSPAPSTATLAASPAPAPAPAPAPSPGTPSFGQRVAELSTKLGLCAPTYTITADADFQAMYSGYAVFEHNSAVVVGRIGEFTNVYGKKKAREACAEKVLEFLQGLAADRAARAGLVVGSSGSRVPDEERGSDLLDI